MALIRQTSNQDPRPCSSASKPSLRQAVHDGRNVSQRIACHTGVTETEAELEKLKELGETINVGIRCKRQPSLVPQEELSARPSMPGGRGLSGGRREQPETQPDEVLKKGHKHVKNTCLERFSHRLHGGIS